MLLPMRGTNTLVLMMSAHVYDQALYPGSASCSDPVSIIIEPTLLKTVQVSSFQSGLARDESFSCKAYKRCVAYEQQTDRGSVKDVRTQVRIRCPAGLAGVTPTNQGG